MIVGIIPNIKAQPGSTNPHAGVIPTRPIIGPTHAPDTDTWPRIASIKTHVINPAAAAAFVFTNATDAKPLKYNKENNFFFQFNFNYLAAFAEPALNPIQPTHNKQVPRTVNGRLWLLDACGL